MTDQIPVAKPATGVVHNTFTANWEASNYPTDYLLSVYEKGESTVEDVRVLFEDFSSITTGSNTSVTGTTTWTTSNTTNFTTLTQVYQAGGAIRFGGTSNGTLTTKALDLSGGPVTLRFKVKACVNSGNPEGTLTVRIDNGTQTTVTYTALMNAANFEQKSYTFPAATATSTVTFSITGTGSNNRRCFLDDIEVIVQKTNPPPKVYVLEDVPTGKVSSYKVPKIFAPETTYYYFLKAQLQGASGSLITGSSNEIEVTTTEVPSFFLLPISGDVNVEANTEVSVTFLDSIYMPGADFSRITITRNGSTKDYFTYATIDVDRLVIHHSPFDVGGAVYTVTVPTYTLSKFDYNLVWSFTLENLPFKLSNFTPAVGATNIAIQPSISVTVDKPVANSSALSGVTVKAAGSAINYASSANINSNKINVVSSALPYNRLITVTVPKTAVAAQGGYALGSDVVWSFTTAKSAIAASTKTPAADDTDVAVKADISVTLTNDVNINGEPDMSKVRISGMAGGVSANFSGKKITILHNEFAPKTKYTVTVPKDAVIGLSEDIVWTFETGNTVVDVVKSKVSPEDKAKDVKVNAMLSVTFDKAPNVNGRQPDWSKITIEDVAAGKLVSGIVVSGAGFAGNTYNISHAIFAPDTEYKVTILEDAVLGLAKKFEWSFTTEKATDIDNETIDAVSVTPTITSGKVTVKTPGAATIKVSDLTGKQMSFTKSNSVKTEISLDNLSAGIYFVSVETNGAVSVHKVVKK